MTENSGSDESQGWQQPPPPPTPPTPPPPPGGSVPPSGYGGQHYGWGPQAAPQPQQPLGPASLGHSVPGAGMPGSTGVIPYTPLTLSSIFEGLFRAIRMNPGTTLLLALIAAIIDSVGSLVGIAILPWDYFDSTTLVPYFDPTENLSIGVAGALTAGLVSVALTFIGTMLSTTFLTGWMSIVTMRSTVGLKTSTTQALQLLTGAYWKLIGMAAILVVFMGVFTAIVVAGLTALIFGLVYAADSVDPAVPITFGLIAFFIVFLLLVFVSAFFIVKLLAWPVVVSVEQVGVFTALGRSWALVRHNFWRTLGIILLIGLIISLVSGIVLFPVQLILTFVLEFGGTLGGVRALNVVLVIVSSVVGSIFSCVLIAMYATACTLLYSDYRIRAEGFGFELAELSAATFSDRDTSDQFSLDPADRVSDDSHNLTVPGRVMTYPPGMRQPPMAQG